MNTATIDVRRMRPVTVAEFQRLGAIDFFAKDERVELIEGAILGMPPIGPEHIGIVNQLTERFFAVVGHQAIIQVQSSITLGDLSAPEPDICLLRRKDDFYRKTPLLVDDVLLVVEVADSSLRYDTEEKLPLYARHGIPEVWIFDIQRQKLVCYREPEGAEYFQVTKYAGADKLSISPVCLLEVAVDLSNIL